MADRTGIVTLLGPMAPLLDDGDVVEISRNPDGAVFVERFGADPARWGGMEDGAADRFLRWCATWTATGITAESPILSGRVPGTAHRIEALVPPVVESPTFSIRRHLARKVTLGAYVPDPVPRRVIEDALAAGGNLILAGATGAGKTTLLNACLDHLATLDPSARLVLIEDTPEIRSPFANGVALRSCDGVGMDRLLVSALRLAPDRIVVGEVRTGAVLMTLLKAWNTGHPGGLVTLHANGAGEVTDRLRLLASEVMSTDPDPLLAAAVDMVVFVRRGRSRPEVASILSAVRDGGTTTMETAHAID